MRTIAYKAKKILAQAFGFLFMTGVCLFLATLPNASQKVQFICGTMAFGGPIMAVVLFLRWKSGSAALRYDRHSLELSTLFRSTTARWSDVRNIQLENLTLSTSFGLFKHNVGHHLVITVSVGDGAERSFRLQEDLLDIPKAGLPALAKELIGCWEGTVSSFAHSQPGYASPPQAAPAPASPAPRPSFGRKMM